MDDNNVTTLTEAQYEWALRLVHILQPLVNEGIMSIFQEAVTLCSNSEEDEKYLMTFQNYLARIPKWNDELIQREVNRIVEKSGCHYLDDLITCVHVVHLKILTSIRTGKTQKKIDVTIPKLNAFIHKIYVHLSRSIYSNVYLFERDVAPLVVQKNRNEFNKLIKTAILDSIREGIPVEKLLRAYLDESTDLMRTETKEEKDVKDVKDVKEEVKEPEKEKEKEKETEKEKEKETKSDPVLEIVELKKEEPSIKFSDKDYTISVDNVKQEVDAPKDLSSLQKLEETRKLKVEAEEDEDKIKFLDDPVLNDLTFIELK
jgi:hypothetical protein